MQRTIDLAIAVLIGLIFGGLIFWIAAPPRGEPIHLQTSADKSEIVIFITGAVYEPGVYTLPLDSRIIDAVTSAGGFTAEANSEIINQAEYLRDGVRIYIPRLGEEIGLANRTLQIFEEDECNEFVTPTDQPVVIINLNEAGQEDLELLPGIGPEKARAILQYRNEVGLFNSIEDILLVPGIGSKLFEGFKQQIVVE